MKLSSKLPGKKIELFKVRASSVIEKPIVTGMAIRDIGWAWKYESGDPFPERAGILLDSFASGHADAHEVDTSDNVLGPYLDHYRVAIGDTLSPQLILNVEAREHAYEFTVELEYAIDGRKYSQIVTLNGKPFKVTADICVDPRMVSKLTPPAVKALRALRYAVVVAPDKRTGAIPNTYTAAGNEPNDFAEACMRQQP